MPGGSSTTFLKVFNEIVDKYPSYPAIQDTNDGVLTYEDLQKRVNNLASYLVKELKCKKGERIGLYFRADCIDAIISLLAVLKAGCAFVLLSTDKQKSPDSRLANYLELCGISYILTQAELEKETFLTASQASSFYKGHVNVTHVINSKNIEPAIFPDIHEDNLAYLICSSGSTGTPKVIAIAPRGLISCM